MLKSFRQKKNLSLRDFSKLVKLGHSYLSEIENNHKPAPSDTVLINMARILGLNDKEKIQFFDAASKSKNITDSSNFHIPADISDYVLRDGTIKEKLREEIYSENKQ